MQLLDLFFVALMPVIKVLIITGVGLFLTLDCVNLLGPTARQSLNNIVFYVFTPPLVAAYLAATVTLEDFIEMWFMPVNILLTYVIGSILGWILLKITKPPPYMHGLVIGCSAAGNLGSLPVIIIPAVCDEPNSPFGDSAVCSTHGKAYASLSMAMGAIYIWSYVYIIVRISATKSRLGEINVNHSATNNASSPEQISETFSATEALLPSKEHLKSDADLASTRSCEVSLPILEKVKVSLKNLTGTINLKMLFAPPTIGAIIGFTVGVVSPLRKLMIGNSAPLRVIYSCANLLGEASIPSMTLINGANLLKGLRGSGVGPSLILGIIVVRYIALPLLGIIVVKTAHYTGLVGSGSLYQFVLMLQFALPPAMSIGTMTQMFEAGQSECSIIMLWTYAVASISLTLWSTLFMWLVA